MLGPYCETEAAAPVIRDLGLRSMTLWRETFPGTVLDGTLVLAAARDKGEVDRFARLTEGHETCRRRRASASSSPIWPAASPPACSIAAKATCRRWRRCASCSSEIERAGVEVRFGTSLAGRASPDEIDHRLPRPRRRRRTGRPARRARRALRGAQLRGEPAPPGAPAASAPLDLRRAVGRWPAHDRRHRHRARRRRPGDGALRARAARHGLHAASGLRRGRDRRDGRRRAPGLRRQRAEGARARAAPSTSTACSATASCWRPCCRRWSPTTWIPAPSTTACSRSHKTPDDAAASVPWTIARQLSA